MYGCNLDAGALLGLSISRSLTKELLNVAGHGRGLRRWAVALHHLAGLVDEELWAGRGAKRERSEHVATKRRK